MFNLNSWCETMEKMLKGTRRGLGGRREEGGQRQMASLFKGPNWA